MWTQTDNDGMILLVCVCWVWKQATALDTPSFYASVSRWGLSACSSVLSSQLSKYNIKVMSVDCRNPDDITRFILSRVDRLKIPMWSIVDCGECCEGGKKEDK